MTRAWRNLFFEDVGAVARQPTHSPAAVELDTPPAAGRSFNAAGLSFELRYVAQALIDIAAVLFGLFFILLLGCAVGLAIGIPTWLSL